MSLALTFLFCWNSSKTEQFNILQSCLESFIHQRSYLFFPPKIFLMLSFKVSSALQMVLWLSLKFLVYTVCAVLRSICEDTQGKREDTWGTSRGRDGKIRVEDGGVGIEIQEQISLRILNLNLIFQVIVKLCSSKCND